MRRYHSLIRVINLTLNEISDIITTKQQRCYVRSGSLFLHFFQGSRSALLHAGSICTAKRNKPRVHNDHTLRKFSSLSNKNEHNLFLGLHSSNRFMKLITKAADGHSDAITQVNNSDVRTVELSACGRRSAELFLFCRTVLASDQRSDSNKQKIDSVKSPPSDMRKAGLIWELKLWNFCGILAK